MCSRIWAELRATRHLVPVTHVIGDFGADDRGVAHGCTSLSCYEPLFGYRGENMHAQIMVGATSTIRDGYFNLTHPGCFLYPSYFKCRPWDRIPVADRAGFDQFTRGEGGWGVPPWQNVLLGVNFASLLLLLIIALEPWRLPVPTILRLPRPVREGS